jgi:hypothetical protein
MSNPSSPTRSSPLQSTSPFTPRLCRISQVHEPCNQDHKTKRHRSYHRDPNMPVLAIQCYMSNTRPYVSCNCQVAHSETCRFPQESFCPLQQGVSTRKPSHFPAQSRTLASVLTCRSRMGLFCAPSMLSTRYHPFPLMQFSLPSPSPSPSPPPSPHPSPSQCPSPSPPPPPPPFPFHSESYPHQGLQISMFQSQMTQNCRGTCAGAASAVCSMGESTQGKATSNSCAQGQERCRRRLFRP